MIDKQFILRFDIVVDNEYLTKYIELVNSNKDTLIDKRKTHVHHIIPRSYYTYKRQKIDDSDSNKVVLSYKDHILAHYYLAMCAKYGWFKVKNMWAVSYMVGVYEKISRSNFTYLDLSEIEMCRQNCVNAMSVKSIREKHDRTMRTDATRKKISDAMKQHVKNGVLFNAEHREKLSCGSSNRVRIHKNGVYTHVKREAVQEYLNDGWQLGARPLSEAHKQALINSHKGKKYSKDLRKKLSDAHLGQKAWNKGIACRQETKTKLKDSITGRIRITNGSITKFIRPEQFEEFEKLGYYKFAKKYNK